MLDVSSTTSNAHALVDQIAASARRDGLFAGVDRLLVGCSGGGDSTALLDILARLAPRLELTLAVAHLHHGWRGAEADADLERARLQAETEGAPFFSQHVDLGDAPGSREEAARQARLGFFRSLVADWGADAVALGHNADDQLETVVLHLARGAGRRGLGGMRPRAEVDGLLLLRPLLDVRGQRLREYARARNLSWSDDSSNQDISLSRNRLRLRLLAELQQIHPGAVGNVARSAALMRDEEEWLDELAAGALDTVVAAEEYPGGVALRVSALTALPRPLQRRVVRRAIAKIRGDCRGIAHEHVEWVIDAAGGDRPARRDLPGVRARREGDGIRLLPLDGRRLATSKKA